MEKEKKVPKDKHHYCTEEEKKSALKTLEMRKNERRIKYADYMLQKKFIEKYWVVKEKDETQEMTDSQQQVIGEMTNVEKPLNLDGAFGK